MQSNAVSPLKVSTHLMPHHDVRLAVPTPHLAEFHDDSESYLMPTINEQGEIAHIVV